MFDAGSIVAKIVLNSNAFDDSVKKSKDRVAELRDGMKDVSREISHFSRSAGIAGAILLTPFVISLKEAAQTNVAVANSLDRINMMFSDFGDILAAAALPKLNLFLDLMDYLLGLFKAMPEGMRESILSFIMLTGASLIAVAALGKLVSSLIFLASRFLTINGLIFIIIGLMYKFQSVSDVVANGVEVSWKGILIVLNGFILGLSNALAFVLEQIDKVYAMMEKLPKQFGGGVFTDARKSLDEMIVQIKGFGATTEDTIKKLQDDIGKIFHTGKGDWSENIDSIKMKLDEFLGKMKDVGKTTQSEFQLSSSVISREVKKMIKDLSDLNKIAVQTVQKISQGLQTAFSSTFYNLFTGQIKSMKQVFAEFGQFILKMIADIIAQLITAFIFKQLLGIGFGAATGGAGAGGMLAGLFGHQEGIDEVPMTGMYKLHTGEQVVPRYDAGKGGAKETPLQIYNMITPEAIAQALAGKEGEGLIVNVIDRNTTRGGQIRKSFKKG